MPKYKIAENTGEKTARKGRDYSNYFLYSGLSFMVGWWVAFCPPSLTPSLSPSVIPAWDGFASNKEERFRVKKKMKPLQIPPKIVYTWGKMGNREHLPKIPHVAIPVRNELPYQLSHMALGSPWTPWTPRVPGHSSEWFYISTVTQQPPILCWATCTLLCHS